MCVPKHFCVACEHNNVLDPNHHRQSQGQDDHHLCESRHERSQARGSHPVTAQCGMGRAIADATEKGQQYGPWHLASQGARAAPGEK